MIEEVAIEGADLRRFPEKAVLPIDTSLIVDLLNEIQLACSLRLRR